MPKRHQSSHPGGSYPPSSRMPSNFSSTDPAPAIDEATMLDRAEKMLEYKFTDREILKTAVVPSKYTRESKGTRRLATLGSAILEAQLSDGWYKSVDGHDGYETALATKLSDTAKSQAARNLQITKTLREDQPEDQSNNVGHPPAGGTEVGHPGTNASSRHTFGFRDRYKPHRNGPYGWGTSNVSDNSDVALLEAMIGAVYLDSDRNMVKLQEIAKRFGLEY